jgi:rubrerythrin
LEEKMADNKTIDILKEAILLEYKGKALYQSVSEKTDNQSAKELFDMLVNEENKHVEILNKQLKLVAGGNDFDASGLDDITPTTADAVLSEKIVKGISGAGYEAAVISAALEFEKNAVKYYGQQEAAAKTGDERKLFSWLVKWETEHMTMLAKIDDEIKEQIWYDNNFWPLD